jgi:hypothetical protein
MARPDYIVCLDCQAELDKFTWREGEVRKAVCDVCGNNDPEAFSLPEDFEQDEETVSEEDEDFEDEYEDYADDEEEEEEE